MTDEQLHSKSDIAAELAYRDSIIQKHKDRIREIEAENERLTLLLVKAANIAHHGGLLGLNDSDVRRLLLPYWDKETCDKLQERSE